MTKDTKDISCAADGNGFTMGLSLHRNLFEDLQSIFEKDFLFVCTQLVTHTLSFFSFLLAHIHVAFVYQHENKCKKFVDLETF